MSAKSKVFGGCTDGRNRLIVAAASMPKAHAAVAEVDPTISLYSMRMYWTETHNDTELQTATAEPGRVFVQPRQRGDYVPVRTLQEFFAATRAPKPEPTP